MNLDDMPTQLLAYIKISAADLALECGKAAKQSGTRGDKICRQYSASSTDDIYALSLIGMCKAPDGA